MASKKEHQPPSEQNRITETRADLKREVDWFNGKALREQSQHSARLFEKVVKKSDLKLGKTAEALDRLYAKRKRFAEAHADRISGALIETIRQKGNDDRAQMEDMMEDIYAADRDTHSWCQIMMDHGVVHDTHTHTHIEEADDCRGGTLTPEIRAECRVDIEDNRYRHHVLYPYVRAHNEYRQRVRASAVARATFRFEAPAPEGHNYSLSSIWVGFSGEGLLTAQHGKLADWPDCMLISTPGTRGNVGGSVGLRVDISQEGRRRSVRDEAIPYTYVGPSDTVEVAELRPVMGVTFPRSLLFFGRERDGGTIVADVTVETEAHSFHRDQFVELDFRDSGGIRLYFVQLTGYVT